MFLCLYESWFNNSLNSINIQIYEQDFSDLCLFYSNSWFRAIRGLVHYVSVLTEAWRELPRILIEKLTDIDTG